MAAYKRKSFYKEIKDSSEERDVERVYKNYLNHYFESSIITYPFNCDGYLEETMMYSDTTKILRLIMEFKYGLDFNDAINRAKVLIQVIFYLKKFILRHNKKYMEIPNVILAGDKTTCFVMSSDGLKEYLYKKIDWSIPPSKSPYIYKDLVIEISENQLLNPIIFTINKNFKFDYVVKDIKRLVMEIRTKFKITESNISETYDYFIERIIKNSKEYSASDLVQSFIDVILGDVEISEKKGQSYIAKKDRRIEIDKSNYSIFEEEYSTKYSIKDKNKFIAIKDRLTEDTIRRFRGEFFTPTLWVNEAHRQLEKVLGSNWKDEYVVWDCAWGTGNLTRDYYFNELYCSTIDKIDIELGDRYNINSQKFVYDFLNDNIEQVPQKLLTALKNRNKIVFFINPPFAEGSNGKQKGKVSKSKISKTNTKIKMENEGLKNSSQQLYIQFLYRILDITKIFNLNNVVIGIFSPTLFLTGERAAKFRENFLGKFEFKRGIVFNASYFANVSKEWGVGFSIWKSGKSNDKNKFTFEVKEKSKKGKVETISQKTLYNIEKQDMLSSWIKDNKKAEKTINSIMLKSGLKYDTKEKRISGDAMGFLMNDSNNIYANEQGVYILSAPVSRHIKTTEINIENYKKCFAIFAARKLIKSNWLNQKDNYCIPDVSNSRYNEWEKDCIIYSIFNSDVTSMRNIDVNNKKYDISNGMFFMGINEMEELADINDNEYVYWDCKKYSKDKALYLELKNVELSKLGANILKEGRKLIKESFVYRNEFDKKYSRYNINTWDAGWYQIKELLKVYMKNELYRFNKLMKQLEMKMIPMVYELGFLKK